MLPQGVRAFGGNAGGQHETVPAMNLLGNGHQLLRRFALPEDDFREALPGAALNVHFGKSQVHEAEIGGSVGVVSSRRNRHVDYWPCPRE